MERIIEIKKNRIIRRIVENSEIFSAAELHKRTLEELRDLQKATFIEMRIKKRFYSRYIK